MNNIPNIYPINLPPKIALVKCTDGEEAIIVQTHEKTFRTNGQPGQQMRVVMPGTTAQINQSHIPYKQDAIERTLAQTSKTDRGLSLGPTSVTNTSIRTKNPLNSDPPRVPSRADIILSPSTTWMTCGSPPFQYIRASVRQPPRARIVSQRTIPDSLGHPEMVGSGNTTISANIVPQYQNQQHQQQIVTSIYPGGQQQKQSQRQQTATQVYSNVANTQQFTSNQLVTMPIVGQRQVQPMQYNTTHLPASVGIRGSSTNTSCRGLNIPVLTPRVSSLPNTIEGNAPTVSTSNITATTGLPSARNFHFQPQSVGQVIAAGRISVNLVHPLIANVDGVSGNRATTTAKMQPSLPITRVRNVGGNDNHQQTSNALISGNICQSATIGQQQRIDHSTATSNPYGIVTNSNVQQQQSQHQSKHQVTQIVGIHQGGVYVDHGNQIQFFASQNIPVSGTVVNQTIKSRETVTSNDISQIVRNINVPTSSTNLRPIARILPHARDIPHQQLLQQQYQHHQVPVSMNISQQHQQNVFLHTRSVNPIVSIATSSVSSTGNPTTYMPTSSACCYEPFATAGGGAVAVLSLPTPTANNPNIVSESVGGASALTTTVSYAPQTSSFDVVSSSTGSISQQLQGIIPYSASQPAQIQSIENDCSRKPRSQSSSSDGSTTVSVASSPNMDHPQQHVEMEMENNKIPEMAFNTVDEIYRRESLRQPVPVPQQQQSSAIPQHSQQQSWTSSNSNGHQDKVTRRKKPRKLEINEVTPVKKFQAPPETENLEPVQIYIRKPRIRTLLDSYKPKPVGNHFLRYTDVKPRAQRCTKVLDFTKQSSVLQTFEGSKIYRLQSQMEDFTEQESLVHNKLSTILQLMNKHKPSSDVDCVKNLIKGNMQRSKIVTDGINEARKQILKILDHKPHVIDIIQHSASKRDKT